MQDNGKVIIGKAWVCRFIYLKSNIIKEIILMVKRTAMAYGKDQKGKYTQANGNKIRNKASDNIMMETMIFFMKADGKKT